MRIFAGIRQTDPGPSRSGDQDGPKNAKEKKKKKKKKKLRGGGISNKSSMGGQESKSIGGRVKGVQGAMAGGEVSGPPQA